MAEPDLARPYRVPLYPLLPLVFLAAATWLVVNIVVAAPAQSLVGLGLIALGGPVFVPFHRAPR